MKQPNRSQKKIVASLIVFTLLVVSLLFPDTISSGMQHSREAVLQWTLQKVISIWLHSQTV